KWDSDNDFSVVTSTSTSNVNQSGSYTNLLPSVDFNIEIVDNLIARASASRTLARPDYGNLFASTSVGGPNRPTYLGGIATGTQGN
ncbi:MAG: TonB-dependent receptor, partial [Xanthomonas perforans]|nr:TonB-dependent receptor [Xanthomonas perforans]